MSIAVEKTTDKTIIIGNCRKEKADIFDFYLMTDSGEVVNNQVEGFTLIFKNEGKFALRADEKVFSCGYGKAECCIKRLLVYVKSEHIVMVFCFDIQKGILPLFDYEFYPEKMYLAPALQTKFQQVDDAVTNLYKALQLAFN